MIKHKKFLLYTGLVLSLLCTQGIYAETVNFMNSVVGITNGSSVAVNTNTGDVYVTSNAASPNGQISRYNSDLSTLLNTVSYIIPNAIAVNSLSGQVFNTISTGIITGTGHIIVSNPNLSSTGTTWQPSEQVAGITVNPNSGQVYITDPGNQVVYRSNLTGTLETSWATNSPNGIVVNPSTGVVYLGSDLGTISAYNSNGTFLYSFAVPTTVKQLAVQSSTGQIFAATGSFTASAVNVYNPNTLALQFSFGTDGSGNGQFKSLNGIAINPSNGMAYASEIGQVNNTDRLQRFFIPSEWTGAGVNVFANAHAGNYIPPANNVNTSSTVELGNGELNQQTGLQANQKMQVTNTLAIDQLNALGIAAGYSIGTIANFQAGKMTVNVGGTLQLDAAGFYDLGKVVLFGGTITTSTPSTAGAVLSSGSTLNVKGGNITLAVQSQAGSLINAFGDFNMGVTSRFDGVNLLGNLNTNNFTVTLNDANQAVLGALTQVGASLDGTLIGTNGLALPQFDTLQGHGVVQAGINSNIILDGFTQGVGGTLAIQTSGTGITKGIGTIGPNVDLSGTTYSPGHSPGSAYFVGATSLTNMLAEIAGITATSQYDQIWVGEPGNAAGSLTLTGGLLTVQLLSGFMPVAGDIFDIIKVLSGLGSPPNIMGAFGSFDFSLAVLNPGLFWNVIGYLANDGSGNEVYRLQVVASVPEPSTYVLLSSLLGLGFLLRKRVRAA